MDDLWDVGLRHGRVEIQLLPPEIRSCVTLGDGVADHYGGRTGFTFLEQRNDQILVLEKLDDQIAQLRTVVNMTGGYGTGILGTAINTLATQLPSMLEKSVTTNDEFHSPERHRLVNSIKRLLADHTNSDEDDWSVTFTSTGSEAMDLALQLVYLEGFNLASGVDARQHKDIVLACHGAWHGWSQGPNQLLDRRQFTEGVPRVKGMEVAFLQYGDIANLREMFGLYKGRIRAVSVEGILGDGGVISASPQWWSELFELAMTEDARIIDDEILTGFRTGGLLAIPPGLAPDCITLGKALGFGLFPMSAVAWRKDVLSLRPGIGVRTFNARPFQAAVVNAGIEIINSAGLFERSAQVGAKLLSELKALSEEFPDVIKAVRGQGLFVGLELSDGFARRGRLVRDTFIRHGVLSEIESGIFNRKVPKGSRVNETIRLTPPLTVGASTLECAKNAMRSALQHLSGLCEKGAA